MRLRLWCVCVNFWVHASQPQRRPRTLNFAAAAAVAVAATNNGAQSLFAQQKEERAGKKACATQPPCFQGARLGSGPTEHWGPGGGPRRVHCAADVAFV